MDGLSPETAFLADLVQSAAATTIFLTNGVKLEGFLAWFDNYTVALSRDGHTQMLYKREIATVMRGQTKKLL